MLQTVVKFYKILSSMKKCYIAGKIGGLQPEVYETNFREAEVEVNKLGYTAVSPLTLTHNHDKSWLSHMREDIAALVYCDAIYMLSNWEDSPGAKIEFNLAYELGLKIHYQ